MSEKLTGSEFWLQKFQSSPKANQTDNSVCLKCSRKTRVFEEQIVCTGKNVQGFLRILGHLMVTLFGETLKYKIHETTVHERQIRDNI